MTFLILGSLLMLIGVLLIIIQTAYYQTPPVELKRQARIHDPVAKALYRAVAYDSSLHVLLWTLIGFGSAASFVLLSRTLPLVIALGLIAILIWLTFVWLPSRRLSKWGTKLAVWATPMFTWLLNYLHPAINKIVTITHRADPPVHSDIYEVEDLLAFLENQKSVSHSRLPEQALEAAQRILTFDQKIVLDIMTPRKQVKLIASDESLGPVLLDELHESGQKSYVVYEGKKDHIVGLLSLSDALMAIHGGKVREAMHKKLSYVNEIHTLAEVLHAFQLTKQQAFIVVNNADEFVGIVTVEDVLHEALGLMHVRNFEAYEDRQAVAAFQVSASHQELAETDNQETVSTTPPEVVE